jgi:hypothetical protein
VGFAWESVCLISPTVSTPSAGVPSSPRALSISEACGITMMRSGYPSRGRSSQNVNVLSSEKTSKGFYCDIIPLTWRTSVVFTNVIPTADISASTVAFAVEYDIFCRIGASSGQEYTNSSPPSFRLTIK